LARIKITFSIFILFILSCEKGIWDLKRTNPYDGQAANQNTVQKDSLPTISTTIASSITGNSVSTGGEIISNAGFTIIARGVCWNTNQNPNINNDKTSDGTGFGKYTSSLTNLKPNTLYYVRAYATSSKGTAYGNEISFTTQNTLPTITTTNVSSTTNSTTNSGGNITDDGGFVVTSKGVCWGTASAPTIANNKTTDGSGKGAFVSNITSLTQNTRYYVRAYATNSQGTSYGNEITFTTLTNPTTFSNNLNDVQYIDNSIGYACGDGIVLKTTNGGTTWSQVYESSSIEFTSIYFVNSELGFVGGCVKNFLSSGGNCYIFKTVNGGLTWEQVGKFVSNNRQKVTGIFSSTNGNLITLLYNNYPNASQVEGYMYLSSNSGGSWTNTGPTDCSMCGFDSGDILNGIVYVGGHVYWKSTTYSSAVYDNSFILNGSNTVNKSIVDNAVNFNGIDMISDYGYGVTDNGKYMITTNRGKNWTIKSITEYVGKNFTCVKFKDDKIGYIGTDDGRVIQTTNSGLNWNEIFSGPDKINSIFIRPDGKITIAGEKGLLKTIN
jgi:photosystem II stability/assembly factor-like uncharacterized protein